jgi:hypothetical protein
MTSHFSTLGILSSKPRFLVRKDPEISEKMEKCAKPFLESLLRFATSTSIHKSS